MIVSIYLKLLVFQMNFFKTRTFIFRYQQCDMNFDFGIFKEDRIVTAAPTLIVRYESLQKPLSRLSEIPSCKVSTYPSLRHVLV